MNTLKIEMTVNPSINGFWGDMRVLRNDSDKSLAWMRFNCKTSEELIKAMADGAVRRINELKESPVLA